MVWLGVLRFLGLLRSGTSEADLNVHFRPHKGFVTCILQSARGEGDPHVSTFDKGQKQRIREARMECGIDQYFFEVMLSKKDEQRGE